MPTYEYGCSNCKHEWEEDQSIKAAATETCPQCGKPTAKRFISRTSFRLVGEGWTPVSLGPLILRAETAALVALAVIGSGWRAKLTN